MTSGLNKFSELFSRLNCPLSVNSVQIWCGCEVDLCLSFPRMNVYLSTFLLVQFVFAAPRHESSWAMVRIAVARHVLCRGKRILSYMAFPTQSMAWDGYPGLSQWLAASISAVLRLGEEKGPISQRFRALGISKEYPSFRRKVAKLVQSPLRVSQQNRLKNGSEGSHFLRIFRRCSRSSVREFTLSLQLARLFAIPSFQSQRTRDQKIIMVLNGIPCDPA